PVIAIRERMRRRIRVRVRCASQRPARASGEKEKAADPRSAAPEKVEVRSRELRRAWTAAPAPHPFAGRRPRAELPEGFRARLRHRPFPGTPWRGRAWSPRRAIDRRARKVSDLRKSSAADRTQDRACRARSRQQVAPAAARAIPTSQARARAQPQRERWPWLSPVPAW